MSQQQPRREEYSAEVQAGVVKVLGECTCDPCWKDRGLAAYDCHHCSCFYDVAALVKENLALRSLCAEAILHFERCEYFPGRNKGGQHVGFSGNMSQHRLWVTLQAAAAGKDVAT